VQELACFKQVLILGEGDGRFLAEFLVANPNARVTVVDVSAGMREQAWHRVQHIPDVQKRVTWQLGDARRLMFPSQSYDLIVTNFFLDCFTANELERLVTRLVPTLTENGYWLVGDFALPQNRFARPLANQALLGMYLFFNVVTRISARQLVDPAPALKTHGFKLIKERKRLKGFLVSSLWKGTG
jgi:ubiquinone/menaquinone biosynthesis C-methylase UbiE